MVYPSFSAMCGICGVFDPRAEARPETSVLDAMSRSIAHRGPDDEGSFLDVGIGLSARRLSIIDLEGGHQPIHNEDRSIWIVFNGEIYNYRKLRGLLSKLGHRFATETDTETVVHAYEEFGLECVRYLNGMFAFALWDARERRVVLARDRFGIKPLYYTVVAGELVFASELKAILRHPRVDRQIDVIALNEYLSFEYVPTPRTIFRGIKRLPPGHSLVFSGKGQRVERYWDLSLAKSERRPPVSWREYQQRLRHELEQAVHKEMVSDVPVGVLLSGGIDSSAVLAMMRAASPRTIRSFSIAFEEKSFDESRYARLVAEKLGSEHHELTVTSAMMADLVPRLMDVLDEPFADSSIVPTYFLTRFAREQVKVVLGGDGGDEMFAGYPTLQAHRLIEYYERWVPFVVRANLVPKIIDRLPVSKDNISFDFKARRFISGRGVPVASRHHRWLGAFVPQEKRELFVPELVQDDFDTYAVAYEHQRACDANETLNQLLYLDQKLYLEGDILVKVDRASMANSLEVRVPLLNPGLAEYLAEVPHELKLRGMRSKFLLKKSMEGILPHEIINRKKKGFNVPVAYWINSSLKELVRDQLAGDKLAREGFFQPSYVERLLREHAEGVRDNRKLIWTLLVFELWRERYLN
ncbi:MAG TPA: asparagine synthase (glutamine-hydrolyzing) [Vicinamibacteria bacterium]|nr:asparagine synthase (glutamine-hydrolyzing) [Vicinamibacteria bacterium]